MLSFRGCDSGRVGRYCAGGILWFGALNGDAVVVVFMEQGGAKCGFLYAHGLSIL